MVSFFPKVFLYQYYGAVLRASDDSQLVQEQLYTILALSFRGPSETTVRVNFSLLQSSHSSFGVCKAFSRDVILVVC